MPLQTPPSKGLRTHCIPQFYSILQTDSTPQDLSTLYPVYPSMHSEKVAFICVLGHSEIHFFLECRDMPRGLGSLW